MPGGNFHALARLGRNASLETAGEWSRSPGGRLHALARLDAEASLEAAGEWKKTLGSTLVATSGAMEPTCLEAAEAAAVSAALFSCKLLARLAPPAALRWQV